MALGTENHLGQKYIRDFESGRSPGWQAGNSSVPEMAGASDRSPPAAGGYVESF